MERISKTIVPYFIRSLSALEPYLDRNHEQRADPEVGKTTIFKLLAPVDGHMIHGNNNGMDTFLDIVVPFGIVCYVKNYWAGERKAFNSLQILPAGKQYALVLTIPKKEERAKIRRGDELGALWFVNSEVEMRKFNNPGQEPTIIKYQRLNELAFPPSAQIGSAGIDLPAAEKVVLGPMSKLTINTGIAFAIPFGHFGLIKGRSGWAMRTSIDVLAGVIDNNYCGPVKILAINLGANQVVIERGDCIAQLLVIPYAQLNLIECEVKKTLRDTKGFGSTGPKADIPHQSKNKDSDSLNSLEKFEELDFSWLTKDEEKDAIEDWFNKN